MLLLRLSRRPPRCPLRCTWPPRLPSPPRPHLPARPAGCLGRRPTRRLVLRPLRPPWLPLLRDRVVLVPLQVGALADHEPNDLGEVGALVAGLVGELRQSSHGDPPLPDLGADEVREPRLPRTVPLRTTATASAPGRLGLRTASPPAARSARAASATQRGDLGLDCGGPVEQLLLLRFELLDPGPDLLHLHGEVPEREPARHSVTPGCGGYPRPGQLQGFTGKRAPLGARQR